MKRAAATPKQVDARAFRTRPGTKRGTKSRAVLILHGFLSGRVTVELVEKLALEMGLRVEVPALPGHWTRPSDLAGKRWPDWLRAAESALLALHAETGPVKLIGHSMGGLLAFYLAALHPRCVDSVLAAAPAFRIVSGLGRAAPWLQFFVPYLHGKTRYVDAGLREFQPNYRWVPMRALASLLELEPIVWNALPAVRAPVWMLQGDADRTVDNSVAEEGFRRLGPSGSRLIRYPDSAHQLFLDAARDRVREDVRLFLAMGAATPR